jgi:hypothetical protein
MRHEEKLIVPAADRIFDPTIPFFEGTPLDRKYRFVDLTHRIPISRNSTYLSASGKRLPGVTTVISKNLGWNKQALINWANQCGLDGKRHRDVSAAEAKAGLLCHSMIDAHIKGESFNTLGYDAELLETQRGFNNFLSWAAEVDLTPVATETPLISEKHQYGGKPDYIGAVNSELSLVDWKTSDGVFPDMLIQLAAYGALWEENYPDYPLTGGYHLLSVGKETASFDHHHWDALPEAMKAFLHLLALHELEPGIKERIIRCF